MSNESICIEFKMDIDKLIYYITESNIDLCEFVKNLYNHMGTYYDAEILYEFFKEKFEESLVHE
jgi:hypothetical protein